MARVIFIIIILAVILTFMAVWWVYSRRWRVSVEDNGDRTEVWLRRGSHQHFIGAAERMHDDYSDRVILMQSEAEAKRDDWNSVAKVLKRAK